LKFGDIEAEARTSTKLKSFLGVFLLSGTISKTWAARVVHDQLAPITSATHPALIAAAASAPASASSSSFAANIRNPHTRRAYSRAVSEFLAWCAAAGVPSIAAVQPVHVATWTESSMRELAAPSVKQRLAAICHLARSHEERGCQVRNGLAAGGSRIRTPGPTSEPHLRRTVQAGVNA
jgi:hypothetical protein